MRSYRLLFLTLVLFGCSGIGLLDSDGDGSPDSEDCAPDDPLAYPDAPDPYEAGGDTNCDGYDGVDRDGDGYPGNEELSGQADIYDCNDNDSLVNPGMPEVPGNGLDEDCDGFDELDSDSDGTPDTADCDPEDPAMNHSDEDEDGWSSCDGDCDDLDAGLSPRDADGDGVSLCEADCDDEDPTRFPGAVEACNRIDDDCDGELHPSEEDADLDGQTLCEGDCDEGNPAIHALDSDGDGSTLCDPTPDCDDGDAALDPLDHDNDLHSTCTGDCDDADPASNPTAEESCDGTDNDCDGVVPVDELDTDSDGFSTCGGDCDDSDPGLLPGDGDGDGFSTCEGDCDDSDASLSAVDSDSDGVSGCDGDCDDSDPAFGPNSPEQCDGLDNDCDGNIPSWDLDNDGDGFPACNDCSDAEPLSFPGAWDPNGDGLDWNCDGEDYVALGSSPATRLATTYSTIYFTFFHDLDVGDVDGDGLNDILMRFGDLDSAPSDFDWPAQLVTGSDLVLGETRNLALSPYEFVGLVETGVDDTIGFIGDIDGDGGDDFYIASPDSEAGGTVWIISSSSLVGPASLNVGAIAMATLTGSAGGDRFGYRVAAGDFDGDGIPDVAVAAPGYDGGGNDAGGVFLFSGPSLTSGAPQGPGDADPIIVGTEVGGGSYFDFDMGVLNAGDADGDGLDDLMVVAAGYEEDGAFAGVAYLLPAVQLSTGSSHDLVNAAMRFGALPGDSGNRPIQVEVLGDVDGDGLSDFLSAPSSGGAIHLITGADLQSSPVFLGPAIRVSEQLGYGPADGPTRAVGDLTGDGVSEIVFWELSGSFLWVMDGTLLVPGSNLTTGDALATFAATQDPVVSALCGVPPVYPPTGNACVADSEGSATLQYGDWFGGDVSNDGVNDLIMIRGSNQAEIPRIAYVVESPY